MGVFQFTQPDAGSQSGSLYKANIDNSVGLNGQIGNQFAAHEAETPNMTVVIEGGTLQNGILLVVKGKQTTATITAPTTNPRIDRVVIDDTTGTISVVTGAEAASPVPPAIPPNKLACCQFILQTTTTQITNSLIVDERALFNPSGGAIQGNFTPELWDDSNSGSEGQTYGTRFGNYIKISDNVWIHGVMVLSSLGTLTTTQNARIGNLPFTADATDGGPVTISFASGLALPRADITVSGIVIPNSNFARLYHWSDALGTAVMSISEYSADGHMRFWGQYKAA